MAKTIHFDDQPWPHPSDYDKKVLRSVYDCLTTAFEKHPDFEIRVVQAPLNNGKGTPKTLYRNGKPDHEPTVIQLAVDDLNYWSRTIYQFSHELCHMLTNHEDSRIQPLHKWFEEAICETASIYVLRNVHRSHEFPSHYARHLAPYAEATTARYKIDDVLTWFNANRAKLEGDACVTDQQDVRLCNRVSGKLIPIFLEAPALWVECAYLGTWNVGNDRCFEDYLKSWQTRIQDTLERQAQLPQIVKDLLGLSWGPPNA